jgi:hypothetical protein
MVLYHTLKEHKRSGFPPENAPVNLGTVKNPSLPPSVPDNFLTTVFGRFSMISGSSLRKNCLTLLGCALPLATAVALLSPATSGAEEIAPTTTTAAPQAVGERIVPTEYGEIIYQMNGQAPQQIYIIGQSHRSAVSGKFDPDTVKVQAEIYRIGEWLIQEKEVEMLLPEGFFQRIPSENLSRAAVVRESILLDNQTLEARLADPQRFINADLLLNASYNIPLGQIENEQLYRDICRLLREASQESSLSVLSRLAGLQDERTTVMLQNIPDIVEEAFQTGRIENRKAMFTIGLGHVSEIIRFLQRGSLRRPGGSDPAEEEISQATLKLLEQGYGVTIIIPKTLAESKLARRLARLETE